MSAMRKTGLLLIVFLAATSAAAQSSFTPEPPPPVQVDFSRDTLLELFADIPEPEEYPESSFRHRFGSIDFRALGVRWRIGYLPFFVPLSGSEPWVNGQRWPDPFTLTGTQIPNTPRSFRRGRAMNAELRRIDRITKEQATVTVKPE